MKILPTIIKRTHTIMLVGKSYPDQLIIKTISAYTLWGKEVHYTNNLCHSWKLRQRSPEAANKWDDWLTNVRKNNFLSVEHLRILPVRYKYFLNSSTISVPVPIATREVWWKSAKWKHSLSCLFPCNRMPTWSQTYIYMDT
jgi:hypothetical protein